MKEGYYFPHFQDARRDIKILRLRRDLGIEGYGIYFMLLEILREQPDFKFPLSDIGILVSELQTTQAKIEVVISAYDLFQKEERQDGGVFFSPKQITYLLPYIQKKEHAKLANTKSQLARKEKLAKQVKQLSLYDSTPQNNNLMEFSRSDSISQKKEEEKKEKEIRDIKESRTTVFTDPTTSDEKFLLWIQEKSKGKDNPSTYGAYLGRKYLEGDKSICNEYELWLKMQAENLKKEESLSLKGKLLQTTQGLKIIIGVEQIDQNFKIFFEDGGFANVNSLNNLPISARC